MTAPRVIELPEFQRIELPRDELPYQVAERLWQDHGKRVAVEFPSPKTGGAWQLTNLGFAGYLPLSPELGVLLVPKVPVGNLFRMLAYAYDLKDLTFFDDLVGLATIQDAYEHLAELLARRVLERARKGLHRAYEPRSGRLQHLRGRIDVGAAARAPWRVGLPVRYAEHTADVDDNRLLARTLERIARSGVCSGQSLRTVRRAHRVLQGTVAAPPFAARDAVGRHYTRLNSDYRTLHALCRFFLEHAGPTHELGEHRMLPFVVDMAQLFERFVAAWLGANLPAHIVLRSQEIVSMGNLGELRLKVDLVLRERSTGKVLWVADTKYKDSGNVKSDDVAQVIAYAEVLGSPKAVLIYPIPLASEFVSHLEHVQVTSRSIPLAGNIERDCSNLLLSFTAGEST